MPGGLRHSVGACVRGSRVRTTTAIGYRLRSTTSPCPSPPNTRAVSGTSPRCPMPHARCHRLRRRGRAAPGRTGADGVTLLANNQGVHVGAGGQGELWQTLNDRGEVVFVHPADLPAPAVDGLPPFAADFLLDTTRAAYLLVRNGVVRTYPNIRFILSHAGGFVPYASHRMALAVAGDTGRSLLDVLDDLRGRYYDTALSSSPPPCPRCSPLPAPDTSSSAATGRSPPPPRASTRQRPRQRCRPWCPPGRQPHPRRNALPLPGRCLPRASPGA